MLPSPSLGPPLLSASRSPAVGPWGIPEEPDELDADDPEEDDEDAGAAELLELVEDADEPPPQPAAASARIASATHGNRRSKLDLVLMSEPPSLG
jgi:hypothetical protein